MPEPLSIIVYSDVICPWCYVGKRRLETALADARMPASVQLAWRPFELNPDMPPEGMERQLYRAQKFGPERSAELDRNMAQIGREAGIAFAFDRRTFLAFSSAVCWRSSSVSTSDDEPADAVSTSSS